MAINLNDSMYGAQSGAAADSLAEEIEVYGDDLTDNKITQTPKHSHSNWQQLRSMVP